MATILQSIEILSKEKGIDPQIVIDAVKDAMLVAARKHYRTTENLVAELDQSTGGIQVFAVKQVVETVEDPLNQLTLEQARRLDPAAQVGAEVRILRPTEPLGRIAAQTAKQVILQKVREAERETVYQEYSERVGELVNCSVKRIEGPDLIVDMGKTEARLPKKEQSKLENFTIGDRFRSVIKSVEKAGKNPGVTVSRAAPELVVRLFEQEVPEIYDSTVVIKACSREAGERTKIAVQSRDRDVDSVGACVGMKGMRVQSIIRELRGEKIDIIEFADDPVVFITHALSPARIARVTIIDPLEKHMEVIVEDTQLSLAIGKKGQNVRLAAKLLGWRVDIKSEEEKRREVASEMVAREVSGAPVAVLLDFGLTAEVVDNLIQAGADSVENVGAMTPEQLVEIPGIQPDTVAAIQIAVNSYFAQFEEAAEEPPEEALERPPEPAAPAPPEEAPETPPEQAAAGAPSPEPAPAGDLPPAPEALPGPEVARETHSFAPADSSVRGESDTIEDAGSSSEQV